MAESAEFRPDELDRIEDALERLEGPDELDDPAPHVVARLQAYRSILSLSRDALAFEDVPASVLDRVMAEARAPSEAVAVDSAAPTAEDPPSRWNRFIRMFLVPGLALAGTAALVLVMARTTLETERTPAAPVAQTDAKTAEGRDDERPSVPAPPSPAAAAEGAKDTPVVAEERAEEKTVAAEATRADPVPPKDVKAPGGKAVGNAPPGTTDDESTVWSTLAIGDRARTSGDCETARVHYRRALEDADAQARSRAHAGLGFCDAWAGEHVSATEHYDEAKKLNPGIADFIDANRPQGTGGGEKAGKSRRKSKAASTPKQAAPNSDDVFDDTAKK